MALTLLDRIAGPVGLQRYDEGNERTVWDHAWPHYLHGLTLSALAGFVVELNQGLRTVENSRPASTILRFCGKELRTGAPVIIG